MQKIRIGLVGAGGNTELRHIPGFQKIGGVELVTVANRSRESSQRIADKYGIPEIAADWLEVVTHPDVDAVCIGTWPYLHAKASIAALENGKHVLTEARMSATLEEAHQMLNTAEQYPQLVAQIVPSPFTLSFDALVQHHLDANTLGNLREIHIQQTMGALAPASAPMTWRQDRAVSGCNIMTMGIYHEVILRWLPIEVKNVLAKGVVHTPKRQHWDRDEEATVDIPDTLSIWGESKGGIHLFYHFSGVESGLPRNEIRLHGEKASLRCDVADGEVYLSQAGSPKESHLAYDKSSAPGWNVEQDFIDSIRDGKPVTRTSFADGWRYMQFTDAVDRSWRSGQLQTLLNI
jgi:predicted dehydrogenase